MAGFRSPGTPLLSLFSESWNLFLLSLLRWLFVTEEKEVEKNSLFEVIATSSQRRDCNSCRWLWPGRRGPAKAPTVGQPLALLLGPP